MFDICKKYSADSHIAEIYDLTETQTDDVRLIRRLLGTRTGLAIFEPFCGTGRIAIPLARDGHRLTALDESEGMLSRLRQKLEIEPESVRDRLRIMTSPAFATQWPEQQDIVILGGNCFYELSSSDEQRALIYRAASALCQGGYVYIDNDDHQSRKLSPSWRRPPGKPVQAFPTGTCQDGTGLEGSTDTAWYDIQGRFVHYVRRLKVINPNGEVFHTQWQETCRPVVMDEVLAWVREAGFTVTDTFGDRQGRSFGPESPRCIVWAQRQ